MRGVICLVAVLACVGLIEGSSARQTCTDDQFECSFNFCIPDSWVCDGYPDCSFGEDEEHCYTDSSAEPTCSDDEYQCWQGSCIPEDWLCDDYYDCPWSDDEDDCNSTACSDGYYECDFNGGCIYDHWVCDGYADCPFADDEEDCDNSTSTTIITTTTTTTRSPPQACRSSFDFIHDRCVLVDPFTTSNWNEARYLCQKFSSDLVVLDDYNFYGELLQYIRNKGLDAHNYWVGATDQASEGLWIWVDSSPVSSGALLWALYGCNGDYQLEPRPSEADSQDCGFLDMSRGLYMSDAACNETFAAICQATNTEKEIVFQEPVQKELP